MYAFPAFKWGPDWLEQTCLNGRKKTPKIPPNPYKLKNHKSNLTIQAEQGAHRCSNPCSAGIYHRFWWQLMALIQLKNFPSWNKTQTAPQCQPLNNWIYFLQQLVFSYTPPITVSYWNGTTVALRLKFCRNSNICNWPHPKKHQFIFPSYKTLLSAHHQAEKYFGFS